MSGVKVLAARWRAADPKALRDTVDQLKNKLGAAAVVLGAVARGQGEPGGGRHQNRDRAVSRPVIW
jgi:alanyl-tRNA synthetase